MNARCHLVPVLLAGAFVCGLPAAVAQATPTMFLTQDEEYINPGEEVVIEVYLTAPDTIYFSCFIVELGVSGGDTGSLDLVDIDIDEDREDFVFYGYTIMKCPEPEDSLILVCVSGRSPYCRVPVSGTVYLATFTYDASQGARGVFSVDITDSSFIRWDTTLVPHSIGADADVFVGPPCTQSADCDDDNSCTTDNCTDGECWWTNKPFRTPCDDGLWCTYKDKCDRNGNCIGGNTCVGYDYCKECGGDRGCCWSPPVECACLQQ